MNHAVFWVTPNAVKFPGTDSVLVIADHPKSREPLIQTERRIFKDRSNLDTELRKRVAGLALPNAAGSNKTDVGRAATRADNNTVRPPTRRKIRKAIVRSGEVDNRFLKGGWGGLCSVHTKTLS